MALLSGKSCLIVGDSSSFSRVLADRLRADGAEVVPDLSLAEASDAAWKHAMLDAATAPKGINAVINIAIPAQDGGFGKTTLNDFRRIMDANYTPSFLALKYGIQMLRASGGGAFINVTTADGRHGAENATARCAISNGIVLMSKSAALECASKHDNVRVNALLVGDIMRGNEHKFAPGHVSANDVAASVAYLVSDAASYLTGLILPVENGSALR